MPVPAFGFSAGDFFSVIGLIKKISKGLKRTGGASSEYQDAVIELKALKNALRHLESLEPTRENENHVNAIRGMALACQFPLRDFTTKLEKYEETLGPFADQRWYTSFGKKSKWAVAFGDDVARLRTMLAAKTISISLLLVMNTSTTIPKIAAKSRGENEKRHVELLSKIANLREALKDADDRMTKATHGIEQNVQATRADVHDLSNQIATARKSLVSLREIGQQMMEFVRTFPLELRDLLQKILQSNWQIYHLLLVLQKTLGPSPTGLLDSNIIFEDALGQVRQLPYQYFRYWEPFEGFLRANFKDKLGEVKVKKGQYLVFDEDRNKALIHKEHWTRSINQGARISMSMIMSYLKGAAGRCPRPSCNGAVFDCSENTETLTCVACNLKFSVMTEDLSGSFDLFKVAAEDEILLKRQLEEDVLSYGSRIEPSDAIGVDKDKNPFKSPRKRSASISNNDIHRWPKHQKEKRNIAPCEDIVTAMDWNAGESPLSAWLNQSAIPGARPTCASPYLEAADQDMLDTQSQERLEQEKKEIEIFKNVQVEKSTWLPMDAHLPWKQEARTDLEPGAQIYYRNIADRYPELAPLLTERFAVANYDRAERLRSQREGVSEGFEALRYFDLTGSRPSQQASVLHQSDPAASPQLRDTNLPEMPEFLAATSAGGDQRLRRKHQFVRNGFGKFPCEHCSKTYSFVQNLKRHLLTHSGARPYACRFCQFTFSRRAILKRHVQKYHVTRVIGPDCPADSDNERGGQHVSCGDVAPKNSSPQLSTFTSTRDSKVNVSLDFSDVVFRRPSQNGMVDPRPMDGAGFWTGQQPSRRSSSVLSCSSSRNSSMRGSETMDVSYQTASSFARDGRREDSATESSSRSLFPLPQIRPPPRQKKHAVVECELCNQPVRLERRQDWQKHIMSDLRPYMCTMEDCPFPRTQYVSMKELRKHEISAHRFRRNGAKGTVDASSKANLLLGPNECPFCGKQMDDARASSFHLAGHMEEIAFVIVPKSYEHWEFYSDSSSSLSSKPSSLDEKEEARNRDAYLWPDDENEIPSMTFVV